MPHKIVKIIVDDDGEETGDDSWHLVDPGNEQGQAALCTQEFFGFGESNVKFETKEVQRDGVTCHNCLRKIAAYKALRIKVP